MRKIKYYKYRFLWHIAPYLPYGKFIHLDIEINNNCNQKCIFCWHSKDELPFKIQSMPYDSVIKYLEDAYKNNFYSVKFNLRGEPLLNPNLAKYIKHAKKLGFVDIMINTNGILLTAEKLFELEAAGLNKCIISVDSLEPVNYISLHGVSFMSFKKLFSNLNILKSLKSEKKIKMDIILSYHINAINQNECFEHYHDLMYPLKTKIRKTMNREGSLLSIFKGTKRKRVCPHLMRRLTITANEKIYPCCLCYNEPLELRLPENDFKTIFKSEKRKNLINDYKKKYYCKSCLSCKSGDIYA